MIYIPLIFPRLPPALKVARDQLSEAKRDALLHAHSAEYHAAMAVMCDDRIERLQTTLKELEAEHVTNSGIGKIKS